MLTGLMARCTGHLPMLTVDMIQIEYLQRIFADVTHGENVIHRCFQTFVDLDEVIFGQFDGRVLVEFRARFTADGDNDEIAWERFACFQLNESDGIIFALERSTSTLDERRTYWTLTLISVTLASG